MGLKTTIRVQKQSFERNRCLFQQSAQLAEQGFDVEQVVVVARLRAGAGQGLAAAVGQEQQVRRAGRFAALVVNDRAPIFSQRVATDELNTGQVEPTAMQL